MSSRLDQERAMGSGYLHRVRCAMMMWGGEQVEGWADPDYLREQQYANAANLDARIALHQRFSTNPQGWVVWLFDRILETRPR
jgi:hypothetical protein